jgi:hypothetical protein
VRPVAARMRPHGEMVTLKMLSSLIITSFTSEAVEQLERSSLKRPIGPPIIRIYFIGKYSQSVGLQGSIAFAPPVSHGLSILMNSFYFSPLRSLYGVSCSKKIPSLFTKIKSLSF